MNTINASTSSNVLVRNLLVSYRNAETLLSSLLLQLPSAVGKALLFNVIICVCCKLF